MVFFNNLPHSILKFSLISVFNRSLMHLGTTDILILHDNIKYDGQYGFWIFLCIVKLCLLWLIATIAIQDIDQDRVHLLLAD